MDYREEGKKFKEKYAKSINGGEFHDEVRPVLQNASVSDKVNFINGLLTGNKNGAAFSTAWWICIFGKEDNDQAVLTAAVLKIFNRLVAGKTDVSQDRSFHWFYINLRKSLEGTLAPFVLNSGDVHLFMPLWTHLVSIDSISTVIPPLTSIPFFKQNEKIIRNDSIKQIVKISNASGNIKFVFELLNNFRDMPFYQSVLDSTEKTKEFKAIFGRTVYNISFNSMNKIENYNAADINNIMIQYRDNLHLDLNAMTNLIETLLAISYNEESITLLLDVIKSQPPDMFEKSKKILPRLAKFKLPELDLYLYQVFQDPQYLPEDIQEMFVFEM